MARSIRSYPRSEQRDVIKRRLKADTKGLGYWGAYDADKRGGLVITKSLSNSEPTPIDKDSDSSES